MKEKIYFKSTENKIAVTNKRLIVKNTTYPITQIASVETLEERFEIEHKKPSLISDDFRFFIKYFLLGLGGIWLLYSLQGAGFFILALLSFSLYFVFINVVPPIDKTITKETIYKYHLIIGISSGKTTAFTSEDEAFVNGISRALSKAIIS